MAFHQGAGVGLKAMGLVCCVENLTCTTSDKLIERAGLRKQARTGIAYSSLVSVAQPG
jgi:hypothetical protein